MSRVCMRKKLPDPCTVSPSATTSAGLMCASRSDESAASRISSGVALKSVMPGRAAIAGVLRRTARRCMMKHREAAMKNSRSGAIALIIGFALAAGGAAHAQRYPAKPVRLLVGFAPGGGVDVTARILAPKLHELWGQPIVVDNRAGAGGTIATDIAAKSPPDGYSLLLCGIWSHGVAPSLYKQLPYDHYRDFAPVSMIGTTP